MQLPPVSSSSTTRTPTLLQQQLAAQQQQFQQLQQQQLLQQQMMLQNGSLPNLQMAGTGMGMGMGMMNPQQQLMHLQMMQQQQQMMFLQQQQRALLIRQQQTPAEQSPGGTQQQTRPQQLQRPQSLVRVPETHLPPASPQTRPTTASGQQPEDRGGQFEESSASKCKSSGVRFADLRSQSPPSSSDMPPLSKPCSSNSQRSHKQKEVPLPITGPHIDALVAKGETPEVGIPVGVAPKRPAWQAPNIRFACILPTKLFVSLPERPVLSVISWPFSLGKSKCEKDTDTVKVATVHINRKGDHYNRAYVLDGTGRCIAGLMRPINGDEDIVMMGSTDPNTHEFTVKATARKKKGVFGKKMIIYSGRAKFNWKGNTSSKEIFSVESDAMNDERGANIMYNGAIVATLTQPDWGEPLHLTNEIPNQSAMLMLSISLAWMWLFEGAQPKVVKNPPGFDDGYGEKDIVDAEAAGMVGMAVAVGAAAAGGALTAVIMNGGFEDLFDCLF
eukprot:NODE_1439_length_1735_cov_80.593052_g1367_i0.p1 GENE.NODE_1439_length_1735_cov_80.593052_g1367_i0~~NODE_1439_length_1735_cov_80.593052_g1367_i0.p1  ORF type:complete len:501 (+),score=98.70 NODE_1439_length_1735_cov_80.593052_g1367_i0:78-1580(+)